MKRVAFTWAGFLSTAAAASLLFGCASGYATDPRQTQGESVGVEEDALFSNNGNIFWNSSAGQSALIPVCFIVRPIRRANGSDDFPNQQSDTDAQGRKSKLDSNGVMRAFDPTALRQLVRKHVEDTWQRVANIEFVGWGDCPVTVITVPNGTIQRHTEIGDLANKIAIHFDSDGISGLGKQANNRPTEIDFNWIAMLAPNENAAEHVHEFGHALGFEHEWLRADWNKWRCSTGVMNSAVSGQCLQAMGVVGDAGPPDGSGVVLAACDGSQGQGWDIGFDNGAFDGTLRINGKYLQVVNNGTANGTLVETGGKNGQANQQWTLNADGTVRTQSGKCLDAPSGASGVRLQIYDCHGGPNQVFSVPGNPITSGINGNKCLDVPNGDPTSGNKVQVYDCNRGIAQNFTQGLNGTDLDGTLRVVGKCLDVINNATANDSKVQISDCHGLGNQQWQLQLDGSIKNPQSGRCLDLTGGNTANGTQLQIHDCNGNSAQKWHVTDAHWGQAFGTPPDPASRMQYCMPANPDPGLSAWDIAGVQKRYGRKYRGSLVGYRGQCANISNASTATGTSIIDYPCRGQWNDTWFRDTTSTTSERFKTPANSRCLNVANGSAPNPLISYSCNDDQNERFTTVGVEWRAMGNMCVEATSSGPVLQACSGSAAQKWDFSHPVGTRRSDQIVQSGTNLCVSAQSATGAMGEALVLATCSASDAKQRFTSTAAGILALTANTALCANVATGMPNPGNAIILWNGCSSSAPVNSQFTLRGKITSLGNCMTTQGPADPGQLVTAAACDASDVPTQMWEYFF